MFKNILSIVLSAAFSIAMVIATACPGCVDLDELSFNSTVKHFNYSLIKFDIAFPYGEKHEAFGEFSRAAHKVTERLLIATVGIKDYGEMENRNLGARFGINEKSLPAILLFRDGLNEYIKLPAHLDITLDNLKHFVTEETEFYIGRDGCVKSMEDAVKNYVNLNETERQAVFERVEKLMSELKIETEREHAKIYLTFMVKINEKGYNFVEDETKRLLRLRSGKVSDSKKVELTYKLNILEAFHVKNLQVHEKSLPKDLNIISKDQEKKEL